MWVVKTKMELKKFIATTIEVGDNVQLKQFSSIGTNGHTVA
jgi:hypothetical protein